MYCLCFLSLSWGLIVFCSSPLLTWAISKYSNGQLIAAEARITPKLDILVDKLDFDLYEIKGGIPDVAGYSRAVKLAWSLKSGEPLIKLSVGPTTIRGIGSFNKTSIFTQNLKDFDFSNVLLNLNVSQLNFENFGTVEEVKAKATLITDLLDITDLSFNASELNLAYFGEYLANGVNGQLKRLSLVMPLGQQNMRISLKSRRVHLVEPSLNVIDLAGDVELFPEEVNISLSIQALNSLRGLGDLSGINIEGSFPTDSNNSNGEVKAKIDFVRLLEDQITFKDVNSELVNNFEKKWWISIAANTEKSEVWSNKVYYGVVPEASVRVKVDFDNEIDEIQSNFSFATANSEAALVRGEGEIEASLINKEALFFCSNLECEFRDINLNYSLFIENEKIEGFSKCDNGPCSINNMTNIASTTKTIEFFNALKNQNLLNPFLVFYLQSAFLSGEKSGKGHEIKF